MCEFALWETGAMVTRCVSPRRPRALAAVAHGADTHCDFPGIPTTVVILLLKKKKSQLREVWLKTQEGVSSVPQGADNYFWPRNARLFFNFY